MGAALTPKRKDIDDVIRQIARPLLGSFFIYTGFRAVVNPTPVADAAQPMLDTAADFGATGQVDNLTVARAYGAVQLAGGLLLAAGKAPRIASLVLAGSMAPATVTHDFWNEPDDTARHAKATQFLKDASLMGGLLIAGFDTEGKPGVQWRARRLAKKASARAAAIAPGLVGDHDSSDFEEYVDRARTAAARLGDRIEGRTSVAAERLADVVDAAKPRVAHAAAVASERATDAGIVIGEALSELRQEASHLREDARGRLRR